MKRLGISIYLEKSEKQDVIDYIDLAAKYGFSRIFTCLLSVTKSKDEIIQEFKEVNEYAKSLGFEIIVDVSPRVFQELNINYSDLKFFQEINADGIRLDLGFTGNEEALMTYNPYNLKIEINMSNDTNYINTIMDYQPNKNNLIGCHNFYPHNYSGLSLKHFNKCTNNFKSHGLRTAAFITSQNTNTFGPWPVTEGLPTLEEHRFLPIEIQLKHLISLNNIDDVIISNCYATEEEFQKISLLRKDMVTFTIEMIKNIPNIEKKIILEEMHYNRGDVSVNLIRSTQSRVKYKGHNFLIFNPQEIIEKGDVIIESSEYGHYAGELQISKKRMINSKKSNVVGKIADDELFLLDEIKPWQKFAFIKK